MRSFSTKASHGKIGVGTLTFATKYDVKTEAEARPSIAAQGCWEIAEVMQTE